MLLAIGVLNLFLFVVAKRIASGRRCKQKNKQTKRKYAVAVQRVKDNICCVAAVGKILYINIQ